MSTTLQVRLREALDRLGITQRELAKRLGVTEGRVSQLFDRDSNPTWESISRIAEACGLRLHVRFCHCSGGGFVCTPCKEQAEEISGGSAPVVDRRLIEEQADHLREWFRLEAAEWGVEWEVGDEHPPAEEQFVRSVLVAAGLRVPEWGDRGKGEG